jgi:hypothetical protein
MTFVAVAIGGGSALVEAGVGLYESSQANEIAEQGIGLAQYTQGQQAYYNNQLQNLMNNPSGYLQNPLFTSSLAVGEQGVNRSLASQGYLGSGNQQTALLQYGNSFANSQVMQQEQLLAGLSGLQASTSSGQAISAASGAQSSSFNQLGSLLASLGYAANTYGGGGAGGGYGLGNGTGGTLLGSTGYASISSGGGSPQSGYLINTPGGP